MCCTDEMIHSMIWKQFLFTQLNFMVNQAPSLHIQKSTETRLSLNSPLIRSMTFTTPQVSTQNQRQVNKNYSQTHKIILHCCLHINTGLECRTALYVTCLFIGQDVFVIL